MKRFKPILSPFVNRSESTQTDELFALVIISTAWQADDFKALDAGWQSVVGQSSSATVFNRAWLGRPRGHSKTSDIAVMATWALFASKRRLSGFAAAADRDQSKLLKDSIERLVRLNRWLASILKVQEKKIQNIHTGSTLEIISSDAPTSYGLLPDFLIVDEITHWQKPDLWESLLSSSAKKAACMLVSIANAGFGDSWQWHLRESVRQDKRWYFSRLDGPRASWITHDRLAEQRRLLPDIAYRRLWLNEWTSGSGDALAETEIDNAIRLRGPTQTAEDGWIYVAGLDLGLSRDKAALAVVGQHVGHYEEQALPDPPLSAAAKAMIESGLWEPPEPEQPDAVYHEGTGRLKLVALEVWSPRDSATGNVDIAEIEDVILRLDSIFNLQVGCDPWQAAYLVQRLQRNAVPIEAVSFTGDNLKSMCSATLEAFREQQLDLYPDPQLLADLRSLRVVEKSYGVRLESPRGLNGHSDTATALSIALHLMKQRNQVAQLTDSHKLIAY